MLRFATAVLTIATIVSGAQAQDAAVPPNAGVIPASPAAPPSPPPSPSASTPAAPAGSPSAPAAAPAGQAAPGHSGDAPAPAPSAPASASQPLPRNDGRYTFHRLTDTYLRLDSRTGQVAICGRSGAAWTCQAVSDERAALEKEIARLREENARLRKELEARGQSVPPEARPRADATPSPSPPAAAPPPSAGPDTKLPSEADLEHAMELISKAWRRMVEIMAEFQRDISRKP